MTARVHVIGGGLAGLAAAVRLRHLGAAVMLYEAAPRAGGRCRSYHDPQLDTVLDNGNHLLLSGNTSAMTYLSEIGASNRLAAPTSAAFDFVDVTSGQRWSLNPGAAPWWILDAKRRVPDTSITDYWSIVRLTRAAKDATVGACLNASSVLFRRFWEPLTLAVLNTAPGEGAASLLQAVLRETVAKGADACRPLIARDSLADALVDPAIALLTRAGVTVRLGTRVERLEFAGDRVASLVVDGTPTVLAANDAVILATPGWIAAELVPGLGVPGAGAPIVNVHYKLNDAGASTAPQIVGVIGGLSQWVFRRGQIASVTISAAEKEAELGADEIAARCWPEVATALGLAATPVPPARVVKERRATPAQTPAAVAARPAAQSAYANLVLAGDWTDTGLPATIEAAVRSGFTAARLVENRQASSQRGAA